MNEEYYKSGNYHDYLDRSHRYLMLALYIKSRYFYNPVPVLDFGCGVGFLAGAFQQLGHKRVYGYDPSEWAIDYGTNTLKIPHLEKEFVDRPYKLTFMLDVLEHIPLPEIDEIFNKLDTRNLVVRIPVPLNLGEDFVLQVSRNDKTHITCLDKLTWNDILESHGFRLVERLDYNPIIWDSEGVFCALYKKR
jgi:SAM-dependent methyltransferase